MSHKASPLNECKQPPRRIMAIWCADLALDRWRHAENCRRGEGPDAAPLALIAETTHGPRIDAANAAEALAQEAAESHTSSREPTESEKH